MILSAVINLAYYLISSIVNVFPVSSGFTSEATNAIHSIAGYLFIWDPLVPISTLATVVGLVFALEIGVFTFKTIKWIMSHVPMVGGKG